MIILIYFDSEVLNISSVLYLVTPALHLHQFVAEPPEKKKKKKVRKFVAEIYTINGQQGQKTPQDEIDFITCLLCDQI